MRNDDGLEPLRLLGVEDAARVLGVRPEAVRIWAREGRLEAFKVGRRLRFRATSIDEFLESCRVHVPDPADFVRRARRDGPLRDPADLVRRARRERTRDKPQRI